MKLIFLGLPHPEFAAARVAERVRQGGHNIPRDVIQRRFHAGLRNLEQIYLPIVDCWKIYDSASMEPEIDVGWWIQKRIVPIQQHRIKDAEDMRTSLGALQRAAKRAREEAIRTQTYLIQVHEGQMVRVAPDGTIEPLPVSDEVSDSNV